MRRTIAVLAFLLFLSVSASALAQPDGLYDRALYLYVKGDFRGAEKTLKEYLKRRPEPSAYYLLGYALYEQRRFSEAIRYFEEAYLIEPDFVPEKIDFGRAKRP